MRRLRNILSLIFISFLPLFSSCDGDETKEIYLEGEPIPGIEIVFPLGYFSGEPMMPKISPDGKKLLFTGPSELPEWKGLWLMDLDTQQKALLHPDGRNADWAPDSEWIAFNIGTEIFKMKIDGTGLTQLTFPIEVKVGGLTYTSSSFNPDWGGDNRIAFDLSVDYRTGEHGARIITDAGEEIAKRIELAQPDWNPDSEKIIGIRGISATSIETQFQIYSIDLNQIETVLTTGEEKSNQFPKFSDDGARLLFFNDAGIHLMNSDGSGIKRIVPSHLYGEDRKSSPKIFSAFPTWHPDEQDIIYEHFRITKSDRTAFGQRVEGIIQFYKVNANDAISVSNLK